MPKFNKTHSLKKIWPPAIVTWVLSCMWTWVSNPQDTFYIIFGGTGAALLPILIAYLIYRFGLSRYKDDVKKLWFSFAIVDAFIITMIIFELAGINMNGGTLYG